MAIASFTLSRIPRIYFGPGTIRRLGSVVSSLLPRGASRVLLVTGASSFTSSAAWDEVKSDARHHSITYEHCSVRGEPTPEWVDAIVARYRTEEPGAVVAIGGGSAIDAGKAVSAMLLKENSVEDFLEGTGSGAEHDGIKVPFVAVPTTAGTGSEGTRNAVLSRIGPDGFKRSIRHENFIPDVAIIDPTLALNCPRDVTITCGLDAFTQLLEGYTSTSASAFSDNLALSGLRAVKEAFIPVCTDSPDNVDARSAMAYAAFLSGIVLANAGLGIVHGLASEIGGRLDIPHGVICATLVASATRMNIEKLKHIENEGYQSLVKYAHVGALLTGEADTENCADRLGDILEEWTEMLDIPRLGHYGFTPTLLDDLLPRVSLKNNPVGLDAADVRAIVTSRLSNSQN
ncbi:MAG: iron-containing alcohol dehydrogenase [Bacteroidota bacterium]|nr:iron-containing alcohol dehydrogenase [Bacteroidota bacterium]